MKLHEKIRHISTSYDSNRFAIAEFSSKVQIWDLKHGLIHKLNTDFDVGNERLCISRDGKVIVVCGYDANTITLYDTENGKVLWTRKDLKECGKVTILNNLNNSIFMSFETQSSVIIDGYTGKIVESLKGVYSYYENPYSNTDLLEKKKSFSFFDSLERRELINLPKTTFSFLDVYFIPDHVLVSYSSGPLVLINMKTNKVVWSTNINGHFLSIAYSKKINQILGIRWNYNDGGPKYLSYIHPNSGTVEKEINLGDPIIVKFLKKGELLITSKGSLISTENSVLMRQFDFENI